ncbi:MAG: glycosyltransferase [Candidatus Marinimicrobia bacterium]|nr:glycosyltransferase [Candidatus Neomarinimicrobiota bacterium]
MKTALAIFVKTPGLSPVKTRLAQTIGVELATEFYRQSVQVTATVVQMAKEKSNSELCPYWAVAEKQAVNDDFWTDFPTIYTGEGGLGERMNQIYCTLLKKHEAVILIGADAPQITPGIIRATISGLRDGYDFVIGPASDGGFYLFAGRSEIATAAWTNVTYSAEATLQQFKAGLPSQNILFLGELTDVDSWSDLQKLKSDLFHSEIACHKNLLNWLNCTFSNYPASTGVQ